jgi:group I intron endonuclease
MEEYHIYGSVHELYMSKMPKPQPLKEWENVVYRIFNKINGMSYIGKTCKTFQKRYGGPRWWTRTHNEDLKKDVLEYGEDSFGVDILWQAISEKDLADAEQYFILAYDSFHPNGYNHIIKVENTILSEQAKKKLSESVKRTKSLRPDPRKGKKLSPEVIQRMVEGRKGIKLSESHKKNLSISNKGKHSHLKGIPKTPEHREKIRLGHLIGGITPEASRKRALSQMGKNHHHAKAVYQINKETSAIIKEYDSIADACRDLNLEDTGISSACKGKLKTSGGYKWAYKDSYNNEIT